MKKRVVVFDLLKFICAICIACFYHYYNDFPMHYGFKTRMLRFVGTYGYLLVELFFIISGFLFYRSYYKKIKSKDFKFIPFFKKKYLGFVPIVALSSFTMFVLQQIYYNMFGTYWIWDFNGLSELILQSTLIQHVLNFTRVSLNNVVWYISVMLMCYILYYFISKLCIKYKTKFPFILTVFAALLIQSYNCNIVLMNSNILRGYISFGIGIVISILVEKEENLKPLAKLSALSLGFILVAKIFSKAGIVTNISLILNFIIYPAIIFILLYLEFKMKKIPEKLDEFIKYLGNISFGIYIWNLPIQLATTILMSKISFLPKTDTILFIVIQVVIHIVVAIISYHFVESKLSFKKLEKYKLEF